MDARSFETDVSWSSPQMPLPDGGGIFAFTICTTVERLLATLSVLYEGGAALGYGYIGEHNVDIIAALGLDIPCEGETLEPTPQNATTRLLGVPGGVFDGLCDCEGAEEMAQILHIGGVAYIAEPCGCGETNFYRLDKELVTVDSDGQPTITERETGGIDFTPISGDYQECVANGFVPYLLSLATNYQSLLVEVAATSIDILTSYDEVVDAIALAAAWLRGEPDLADYAGLVTGAVEDAFSNEGYQETMISNFSNFWDGLPLTRENLQFFAYSSPQFVGLVPVRWLLRDWAKYCKLDNLNRQLQMFAGGCEGGYPYNPGGGNMSAYDTYEYNGLTYPLYDIAVNYAMPKGETSPEYAANWLLPEDYRGDVQAMFVDFTVTGVVGNQVDVNINDGTQVSSIPGISGGTLRRGTGDNTQELMIEEYTGQTWDNDDDWTWNTIPSVSRAYGTDGAIVTINRVIIVGTPV